MEALLPVSFLVIRMHNTLFIINKNTSIIIINASVLYCLAGSIAVAVIVTAVVILLAAAIVIGGIFMCQKLR